MTISEFLKSIGVPDDKVQDAEGKMKSYLDGDYVTKARFNELNESKKSLAEQIVERDKQLTSLKKSAGDNEGLKISRKPTKSRRKRSIIRQRRCAWIQPSSWPLRTAPRMRILSLGSSTRTSSSSVKMEKSPA